MLHTLLTPFLFLSLLLTNVVGNEIIKLRNTNHVVLRGPIDNKKASNIVNQLVSMKSDEIFLYIDSPGGSVLSGLQIVQTMESLQKSGIIINTIANNAASMAFIIHQAGTNRYVRPWSVLMQHQMSYSNYGPYHNVKSREYLMDKLYMQLLEKQARRANTTSEEFKSLVAHDMWLLGYEAVEKNYSDKVVDIMCDFEPSTVNETYNVWLFQVDVTYSSCPLASEPLSVVINGNPTTEEKEVIMEHFNTEKQLLYKNPLDHMSPSPFVLVN